MSGSGLGFTSNDRWEMGTEEIGQFADPTAATTAGSFRMYIPKLMPLIGFALPKQVPATLNKSIFINDPSCMPAPGATITTQNYITITRTLRGSFKIEKISRGQSIVLECRNKNEDTLFLKNDVDPQRMTEAGARDGTIHNNVFRLGGHDKHFEVNDKHLTQHDRDIEDLRQQIASLK